MCVVSAVYDFYNDRIPWMKPYPYDSDGTVPLVVPEQLPYLDPPASLAEILKAVESFRRARAAAEIVDQETGQADCVDPEKQKLLDRIAELEKIISNPPEVVIVKGGNLEPGTYRVIDKKLYKVIE